MTLNHHSKAAPAPPTVTVAMPVYNGGEYLRLAVLSIVKQTFTDWELLIIDDGSTDDSLDTIADIRDERIRVLRDGTNKGLAARLNEAIDLARGRYLARMDQDDVSYPERFARQVEVLEKDPLLDLVAVIALRISKDNKITGILPWSARENDVCARPWRGFYLPHPTWMGRIEWFKKYRYRVPGPYFCEDQELLLRSYEESRFDVIREPLFAYRRGEEIHWRKQIRIRFAVLIVQLRHFLGKSKAFLSLMALLTYVGRSGLDVMKECFGISYPVMEVREGEIYRSWHDVLDYIQNEPHRTS